LDYQLEEAIDNNDEFKIYYRKKDKPYTYLGSTNDAYIENNRKVDIGINSHQTDRLQVRMCVVNFENIKVPENKFIGVGRYKKDMLVHAGLRDDRNTILINHNKNTNIGFYYYQ